MAAEPSHMMTGAVAEFHWRAFSEWGGLVENPSLRQPISLIIDDPNPGYNPAYFHLGFRHGPMHIPRELIDEFADLMERESVRGKFSVIPNPFGFGRIDREVQGISQADLHYFLDAVRERIAPVMDITPEVLTHWNAIDLPTGNLLPLWENAWSREQDRTTLTPYLALSLEIMNNVNLPCAGMTSPWNFGDGVEDEYAEAVLAAQQAVNGHSFTWYFLHMDNVARQVPQRLPIFRPERGEAVISVIACDGRDFGSAAWTDGQPDPDILIAANGRDGRLAEVLDAGGPGIFHTHWQTIFSRGTRSGLHALAEVLSRLRARFGDQVVWTRVSDLAQYAGAAAAVQIAATPSTGTTMLAIDAPFPCSGFTLSVPLDRAVAAIRLDGRPLRRVAEAGALVVDCYLVRDERIYLCWSLRGQQQIVMEWAPAAQ